MNIVSKDSTSFSLEFHYYEVLKLEMEVQMKISVDEEFKLAATGFQFGIFMEIYHTSVSLVSSAYARFVGKYKFY